jgi:hypothetical protein
MARPRLQFCCSLLIAVTALPFYSRAQIGAPEEKIPTPAEVLNSRELSRLKPIVERDLQEPLKRAYNLEHLSQADLDEQFARCRITRLKLGKLGEALLVEGVDVHSRNEPMINVYVPTPTSYRLLIAESGFGPELVPSRSGIPFLIFGGTSGPGTELLIRFHYSPRRKKYVADGCNTRATADHSCPDGKLPKFPYQWPD